MYSNIYEPKIEDADFFHNINKRMGNIGSGHMIIAGDFNQLIDGVLYKTEIATNEPKDKRSIKLMMKDLGLVDIGRQGRRSLLFFFFSHKHKSHFRTDYYFD